jgi:hypothetical protein
MIEASRSGKIRKVLMPGFGIRVGTNTVFFKWFAIDLEFCYEFLPVPLERRSSRKLRECLEVIRIMLRRIDRIGVRGRSPPVGAPIFRSSQSALRLAALTPAGSFWTHYLRTMAWLSSSCSTSTQATIA